MENPYQPPDKLPDFRDQPIAPAPMVGSGGGAGMTSQVTVVAILMIVQGVLCTLMGICLLPFAFIMPVLMQQNPDQFQGNPPPEGMFLFMGIMYGVMGLAGLIPGIVLIYAGIKNLKYKGRILGFVALGVGTLAMGNCYCGITAIGLLVYGLIVYLNEPVKIAFELGERGYTKDQIMAHFYGGGVPQQKPPGMM